MKTSTNSNDTCLETRMNLSPPSPNQCISRSTISLINNPVSTVSNFKNKNNTPVSKYLTLEHEISHPLISLFFENVTSDPYVKNNVLTIQKFWEERSPVKRDRTHFELECRELLKKHKVDMNNPPFRVDIISEKNISQFSENFLKKWFEVVDTHHPYSHLDFYIHQQHVWKKFNQVPRSFYCETAQKWGWSDDIFFLSLPPKHTNLQPLKTVMNISLPILSPVQKMIF